MRLINRTAVLLFAVYCTGIFTLGGCSLSNPEKRSTDSSYVIVVSQDTYCQQDWQAVIKTLRVKHNASVIIYSNTVTEVTEQLSEYMPDYTCFVEPADNADRDYVVSVHRLTRKLDSDPYTDTQWAILTGYDVEDALRIAQYSKHLSVEKAFSGTVSIGLDRFNEGYQFDEGKAGVARKKLPDGTMTEWPCPDDSTETIVNALQDNVDVIYTSGHGMTNGWQIGYNYKDGFIRSDEGQLYGLDSNQKRIDFSSKNTKVYLPTGNCLVGLIPQRDCYATALMHSGGVNQMFGYIVVTFYGYMGWGIDNYFGGMPGKYSLSEAFYANQQALLYELGKKFPEIQQTEFDSYEYQNIHKLANEYYPNNNDAVGMLWDRDAIAFYGDPAWVAALPEQEIGWSKELIKLSDNTWQLEITTSQDGNWPGRPIISTLPERMANSRIIVGSEHNPVITDNFVLMSLSGKYQKGTTIRVVFSGEKLDRKTTSKWSKPIVTGTPVKELYKDIVEAMPSEYQQQLYRSLYTAGNNAQEIAKAMSECSDIHKEAAAFLVANMPKCDLRTLNSEFILDNIYYTYMAKSEKDWNNIPNDIFLNNVLPYANLDEVRVQWRQKLMETFMPVIKDCQRPSQAAQKLNKELWSIVNVKYSTDREKANQNPFESMESGIASCTGLSIMLIDACRSVGIPARIAGIAKWPHKDGNHSWVEIWDGKWYTLGAWDGEDLDKVWFDSDAARAKKGSRLNGIFAASYKKTDTPYLCVWAPQNNEMSAVEVTDRYLKSNNSSIVKYYTAFRVLDANGNRVAAKININNTAANGCCAVTKDESRDLNDTIKFNLEPGTEYEITITYKSQTKKIKYTPKAIIFQTVDITLDK